MSVGNILSVVTILINMGMDLYTRIDSVKQAPDDLLLLTTNLKVLRKVFEEPENDMKAYSSEFMRMLAILESIRESCTRCAKVLGVEPAGTTTATRKTAMNGKSWTKRARILLRFQAFSPRFGIRPKNFRRYLSIS